MERKKHQHRAEEAAEERILDALTSKSSQKTA